jgi:hypothetical protein
MPDETDLREERDPAVEAMVEEASRGVREMNLPQGYIEVMLRGYVLEPGGGGLFHPSTQTVNAQIGEFRMTVPLAAGDVVYEKLLDLWQSMTYDIRKLHPNE